MSNDAAATFLSDRSLSDRQVERALIEEIDRVLADPPRRSYASGELIVRSNEALS